MEVLALACGTLPSDIRPEVQWRHKVMVGEIKSTGFETIVRKTLADWNDDNAPRLGAALAFYMLLSLAPMVLLTIAGVSLVFGRSASQAEIVNQVQRVVGNDGADAVLSMIQHSQDSSSGGWASVLGVITLLFGASGVFAELRDALNTIWDVKFKGRSALITLIKDRFFSFGMVVLIALLMLMLLAISTSISVLGKFFNELLPVPEILLSLLNSTVSLVVLAVVFSLVFKYVPEARTPWKPVWIGGAVTALLFTIGDVLIGLYLGKAGIGSTYGAAGSLIVIVVWAYYSAQIFFLGAEFTHVLAESQEADRNSTNQVNGLF